MRRRAFCVAVPQSLCRRAGSGSLPSINNRCALAYAVRAAGTESDGSHVFSGSRASNLVSSPAASRAVASQRSSGPHLHDSRAGPRAATAGAGASALGTPGKVKRPGNTDIKVRRRAPWGLQQLRDSWSEDAMTRRDTENMSERIHREYRYHPDEFRRHYIKYTALLTIPCLLLAASASYYYHMGKPIWQGDPQHLLNLLRALDTSPRSALYAYRLEDTYDLPPHVVAHREANRWRRDEEERIFAVTRSSCAVLTEDLQRQMALLDSQRAEAASVAENYAKVEASQ